MASDDANSVKANLSSSSSTAANRRNAVLADDDHRFSHSYNQGLLERLMFRVARKWVAGYDIGDAIRAARDSNTRGMAAILNFLGEDTTEPGLVDANVREYLNLMDSMHQNGIDGCISVKPTQLGLAIDYDLCLVNFGRLVKRAGKLSQFMWMDMESVRFTEDTISIYLEYLKNYSHIGIAIQAYLKRSASDLLHIVEEDGRKNLATVRLVKGAYNESKDDSFESKDQVDYNYSKLMGMLFESRTNFAIATHDCKIIDEAIRLSKDKGRENLEFQMLMGIRDNLKSDLIERGMKVSEYIPYGTQWLPYSVRRIRERKRNLILLARSLVQE